MIVPSQQEKVLLRPADIKPLCPDFDVVGVFNPAATRYGDEIILLVRVSEQPRSQGSDHLLSPRAKWENGRIRWVIDTFDPTGVDDKDPRKFSMPDGSLRLRFISHLRLVRLSSDGMQVNEVAVLPNLLPREPWEEFGIEDARITKIDDIYYITYVAISRKRGVATALMSTRDFQTFERHGIIFPTENKNVVLLPEKWRGYFVAYHRPVSDQKVNAPSIETALSKDTIYWGKFKYLFGPRPGAWDSVKVGAGPPPLRLPEGWLFLYHGVSSLTPRRPVGRYCIGAALLDGDNPLRLLARSKKPLLYPPPPYEQQGYVPDVVFPTGAILSENKEMLLLFSGAADEATTLLTIPCLSIIKHLRGH